VRVLPNYRAYVIGEDGVFCGVHEIDVPNDADAIAKTVTLIDGLDLELWDGARAIGV
jgi:hypothetical protein